ncbi:penicillin-binding transpeptidase domain-containing protein [Promicromonospora thailandica]|uniref:Beta-lactamase n=1 Tax=Promicromonospora thailandica TaxID=765201 RepID=A0A9X2FZN7_9MICO|nr:penicillin-binding transpeptidase domain-containing protein [Promicromonospora thailandica]MCP2263330.1 Cell division protein FtsI/penicillin-binding protein 2 [Promicromonospora thailandica]
MSGYSSPHPPTDGHAPVPPPPGGYAAVPPDTVPPPPPPPPAAGRPGRRALVIGVVVLLLAAAGVAAWFLFFRQPPVPDPEPAAERLAAALQAGTPADVPLVLDTSASPDEQYAQVFEQLRAAVGEEAGTVTVADVTPVEEGDGGTATATATLAWSWPVATDTAWDYETVVRLSYPGATDGEAGEWAAAWDPGVLVPGLEPAERLAVERTEPARGEIVTTTGETLVGITPVHHVGIDKTRPGWDTAAPQLGTVLGLDQAATDDVAARVASAGEKAFVQVITIRDGDPEYDFDAAMAIPGVVGIPDEMPLARSRDFARSVLGTVGEATAEIIEESEGTVRQGDVVGVSGLQAAYDEQLRGVPGLAVTIEPAGEGDEGGASREAFTIEKQDGKPLVVTLDPATQLRAEAALADITDLASAIVAIRPSSGEVLAVASGPGSEGYNTATLGQYPPGSTFKIATSLAMIRSGVTPDTPLPCTPTIAVEGREFRNVPGYPASALGDAVPFRTVFANSCNTAFIAQHQSVTQQQLHDAAASLGLGVEATGFGAAGTMGDVPAEATGTEHAASMIGQGQVLATPLAMATVGASVAAGHTVSPWLVQPENGEAPEAPSGDLTAEEAATLRDLMGGVVREGSGTTLQDVPGIVGAKTGTAQFGDGSKAHVWMVAVTDDLAAAVFIEEGDLASTVAAPVMHEFLTNG